MPLQLGDVDWSPVLQGFPTYKDTYARFRAIDAFGTKLLEEKLRMEQKDVRVAIRPIPGRNANPEPLKFPYAMAWPITVCKGVTNSDGTFSQAALLALADTLTALHIMLAFSLEPVEHESVSMQCNTMQTVRCEESLVVVTCIERINSYLIFSTVEVLRGVSKSNMKLDPNEKCIDAAIRFHSVCASASLTKALLPHPNAVSK